MKKRIVKSPKLYFYDTGLLCHLLGIKSSAALQKHAAYGSIFENWVITEIRKNNFNAGLNEGLYYFRDSLGNEVDLITEKNGLSLAIEIKASKKVSSGMLRGLHFWQKNQPNGQGILLYSGATNETVSEKISIASWTEVKNL
jgi:hypothetical protein